MKYKKPIIIAEMCGNHKGSMEIAKEMIDVLVTYCKVDVIKFQKRDNKFLLTEEEYNSPHPVPENSYGKTYGEHREFLEFDIEQHRELKKYIEDRGVVYSTSVWEEHSTKEVIECLNPEFIKIPSACNLNFRIYDMIKELNYMGDIHISLGMTSKQEFLKILHYLKDLELIENAIFYHCTSGYPIEANEMNLLELKDIQKYQWYYKFKDIAFSGHHKGISNDVVAYTLGATYIERHFSLDRTWKGTDHSASLEPDGMRKLVRNLNSAYEALTYMKSDFLDCEIIQRKKLKKIKN